eukprot:SM000016S01969  [mRNA]  locus=s16:951282:951524:- [translate_table: standard]
MYVLLGKAMSGVFLEAGYTVAMENSSIMPLKAGADGRLHPHRAPISSPRTNGGDVVRCPRRWLICVGADKDAEVAAHVAI